MVGSDQTGDRVWKEAWSQLLTRLVTIRSKRRGSLSKNLPRHRRNGYESSPGIMIRFGLCYGVNTDGVVTLSNLSPEVWPSEQLML